MSGPDLLVRSQIKKRTKAKQPNSLRNSAVLNYEKDQKTVLIDQARRKSVSALLTMRLLRRPKAPRNDIYARLTPVT
jgi:hypothetical protein